MGRFHLRLLGHDGGGAIIASAGEHVGTRHLGRPPRCRFDRCNGRGRLGDLHHRARRNRRDGRCEWWVLLHERRALRLAFRIERILGRRVRLEPVALGRDAAVAAIVALAAAVDGGARIGVQAEGIPVEKAVADGVGDLRAGGVEGRERVAQGWSDRCAEGLHAGEFRPADRAGGRCKGRLLRAVDDQLMRNQRGEVSVPDLARQQQQRQNAEAEGGLQAALRPFA